MKKITVEISEEIYEMLSEYAISRKQPVGKIVEALIEKFAPVSHTMIEEEVKNGYEEVGEINLDWANL